MQNRIGNKPSHLTSPNSLNFEVTTITKVHLTSPPLLNRAMNYREDQWGYDNWVKPRVNIITEDDGVIIVHALTLTGVKIPFTSPYWDDQKQCFTQEALDSVDSEFRYPMIAYHDFREENRRSGLTVVCDLDIERGEDFLSLLMNNSDLEYEIRYKFDLEPIQAFEKYPDEVREIVEGELLGTSYYDALPPYKTEVCQ